MAGHSKVAGFGANSSFVVTGCLGRSDSTVNGWTFCFVCGVASWWSSIVLHGDALIVGWLRL